MNDPDQSLSSLPHYDWQQSYDWNYEHAPEVTAQAEAPMPGPGGWDFCGRSVASPLGLAAGPLLNGRWILYYAVLGFDVLTYKTVRSRARACYPIPNLQPVTATSLRHSAGVLPAAPHMQGSWAVSFGMPSKDPSVWRADVEQTRRKLSAKKILSVSVVATPEPHWAVEELADDFARCGRWAMESGADAIEANFSCPNVSSADGQVYQQPQTAGLIAAKLRQAVGSHLLLIKIGHVTDESAASALCRAVAPSVNALVMVNCLSAQVIDGQGRPLFDGQSRGIAGEAIREAALDQVTLFARVIQRETPGLRIVGVGGLATAEHVRAQLQAGSHAIQLATAAMLEPGVGLDIRRQWTKG